MDDIIEMHQECIKQVEAYDYFKSTFQMIVRESGFKTIEEFNNLTDLDKIITIWNDFWYALPDSSSIHRKPFDLICDICEGLHND